MEFPSFASLFNTFAAKFKELIPSIDPTVRGSWSGSFGKGMASIGYSLVVLAKQVLKQFNPLTATGDFLGLWASYDDLTLLDPSLSIGRIKVFGDNSTVVVSGTKWAGDINGLLFSSSAVATIQPQDAADTPVTILSLNRSATTVTAFGNFPHGFTTGDWVKMSGADQSEYNGNFQISVFDKLTFTYTIVGTPVTPATGTPFSAMPVIAMSSITSDTNIATAITENNHGLVDQQYVQISEAVPSGYNGIVQISLIDDPVLGILTNSFTYTVVSPLVPATTAGTLNSIYADINVTSDDTGPETAVTSGGTLTLQGTISGVDSSALTFEGLQGGANQETEEEFRSRILLSRSQQEGVFTNDQITLAAKLINGNTRIYIQNPDSDSLTDPDPVLPGQVRIFIIRDNDPLGLTPTGSILQTTKQSIIENGKMPAEMWEDDVFVLPPVLKSVDITMTNVKPDTATMRTALKDQFNAYFTDSAIFGVDVDNDVLRGSAIQTQDLNSGDLDNSFIKSFEWTDVSETIEKDELPILGTLTVNGVVVE